MTSYIGRDPNVVNRRITSNLTITVASSGGDFTTVGAAYDSLDDAFIEAGVTVTISVGAGTFVESTITLDHPQGQQINITGAGSGSTTLSFSADGNNGFFCENNRSGTIDALTILSTSTTKYGVYANNVGIILLGTGVVVDGWNSGIRAFNHSAITAVSVTVDDASSYGVFANVGSTVYFTSGSITQTSVSGNSGLYCGGESLVQADSCSIQGASRTGACVQCQGGTIIVDSADIDDGSYCISADRPGSSVIARSANLNSASTHNVRAVGDVAIDLSSATNTNSAGYGVLASDGGRVNVTSLTTSGHSSGNYNQTLNTAATDGTLVHT